MKRVPVAYVNFVMFLKRVFIYAWILELNIILSIFFSFSCAQKAYFLSLIFIYLIKDLKNVLGYIADLKQILFSFSKLFDIDAHCTVWCITYNTLIHTVHSAVVEFIKEGVTKLFQEI